MNAADGPNFLGPISYGTQQVEPQFIMAYKYILTSGPVLYQAQEDIIVIQDDRGSRQHRAEIELRWCTCFKDKRHVQSAANWTTNGPVI